MSAGARAPSGRVEVPGSHRAPTPAHSRVGDIEPGTEIEVSVYVRPRASLDWVDSVAAQPPGQRAQVSRDDWAKEFGADPADGGTSAVAPLWAGLIACLNQRLGTPVGFVQPLLYPLLGGAAFHDITTGSNGAYSAGPGWDACTGLGSPNGGALAAGLAS